jgi:hypothetical protein
MAARLGGLPIESNRATNGNLITFLLRPRLR